MHRTSAAYKPTTYEQAERVVQISKSGIKQAQINKHVQLPSNCRRTLPTLRIAQNTLFSIQMSMGRVKTP